MASKFTPQTWNWDAITQGDTFPAQLIRETLATSELIRARIKVKDILGTTLLTLDSDTTGINIDDATAGQWEITVEEIDTTALPAGCHKLDLEITSPAGFVRTVAKGRWLIEEEITD